MQPPSCQAGEGTELPEGAAETKEVNEVEDGGPGLCLRAGHGAS